jgi:hypothetical protein
LLTGLRNFTVAEFSSRLYICIDRANFNQ